MNLAKQQDRHLRVFVLNLQNDPLRVRVPKLLLKMTQYDTQVHDPI